MVQTQLCRIISAGPRCTGLRSVGRWRLGACCSDTVLMQRRRTISTRPHCRLRLTKDMMKSWSYCENMDPSRNTLVAFGTSVYVSNFLSMISCLISCHFFLFTHYGDNTRIASYSYTLTNL